MFLAFVAPVAGQDAVLRDTALSGSLTDNDSRLPDGNPYDQFVVAGAVGNRVRVRLRSTDFDAFVLWGTLRDTAFTPVDGSDDGAGESDAELNVTLLQEGLYAVRVTSFSPAGRGAYTLEIHTATLDTTDGPPADAIRAGERVRGSIVSAMADTAMSVTDAFVYHVTAGESLDVKVRSSDFTPYLRISTVEQGVASILDERVAVGGSAQLRVALDRPATLLLEAGAQQGAVASGDYTLDVASRLPSLQEAPDNPDYKSLGDIWILQTPVRYRVGATNDQIIVPAGFVTDRASIPYLVQWLIPKDGRHSVPAIIHDYLYWTGTCTQRQADRLLMHAMADSRAPSWQRRMIYKAVDLFGGSAYSQNARDRTQGAIRVLPQAWRKPPVTMNWNQYLSHLHANRVAPDPNIPVEDRFCRRGNELRPPGVPY
jgi:hypothetical protein